MRHGSTGEPDRGVADDLGRNAWRYAAVYSVGVPVVTYEPLVDTVT